LGLIGKGKGISSRFETHEDQIISFGLTVIQIQEVGESPVVLSAEKNRCTELKQG
jgi:hypothetical protein